MDFLINGDELSALCGLPHIQQLVYFRGIRPYMDVKTGEVGIKRKISYQSIAEQLYIEPHQGIKSESFSRAQIRRAVAGLERAGLISVQSEEFQLILKCNLVTLGYFVQNKAVTNPSQQAVILPSQQSIENKEILTDESQNPVIGETPKADTPLNNNYLYIFLLQQFEKFWDLYPQKKSKQKAWEAFQALNPDETLCAEILAALKAQITMTQRQKAQGHWVATWKYPANWLAQSAWLDELDIETNEEVNHEKRSSHPARKTAIDTLWDSCKSALEPDVEHNIIALANYRKTS